MLAWFDDMSSSILAGRATAAESFSAKAKLRNAASTAALVDASKPARCAGIGGGIGRIAVSAPAMPLTIPRLAETTTIDTKRRRGIHIALGMMVLQ
jgi:hypothetical protein